MQLSIHPNDLPVLAKIFNPHTKYIFISKKEFKEIGITDTLGCQIIYFESDLFLKEIIKRYSEKVCTIITLSTDEIYPNNLTSIQIGKENTELSTSRYSTYQFINNPDKTIRWLYPIQQKHPSFLHLYNASGWKGKAIKKGIQFGFRAGLKKWIKQGTIQVYAPYAPIGGTLQKKSTLFQSSDFAIFTGTKGANRKAVIVLEKNKKATHFLKVPLTHAAKKIVQNESRQLKQLEAYSFQTLVLPQARQIHDYLLQTNICPTKTLPNLHITSTHLRGLQELYQKTTQWQLLATTPIWTAIEGDLAALLSPTIANNLPLSTIQQIVEKLEVLKSHMDLTLPLPLAIGHGDFTPWNTYLTKNNIRVYDWELAARMPLLYDAFHFIFQTSILVKKLPYTAIKQQIEQLRQQSIVQSMQQEFSFSFDAAYQFYLLRTISYYLNRYIQQVHLHEQAHWLVDTWTEALVDCLLEKNVLPTSIKSL